MSGDANSSLAATRSVDGTDVDVSVATDLLGSSRSVLIYGMNYAPEPIGVGRYTGDIGAYLSQNGVRVTVVTAIPHYPGWKSRDGCANWYKTENLSGACVVRCPLVLKSEMRGVWRLIAPLSFAITSAPVAIWNILTKRPDAVLCVEPTLFSSPLALCCAKLVGARTILHVQDLEIDAAFAVGHLARGKIQRFAYWLEGCLLKRFSSIVTISSGMRDMLIAKGAPAARLMIVRNWVDIEMVGPTRSSSWMREELNLSPDVFIALYAGNIGPKQALPLVFDAATALSERPDIVFVIVGEGPEKSSLVAHYGHLPNVHFLPVQPEERFCELLSSVDCHLLPQHADTTDMLLPSKLGGMLASGKPSIVMAAPGTELFNFLAGAAIVIPPGDAGRLAAEIKALVEEITVVDSGVQLELVKRLDKRQCIKSFLEIVLA